VLQAVVVPIFALFFLADAAALPPLALVLVLTNLGIALVGALVASLALMSRARELLVPLLLLPMMVPLVIGAAGAAEPILAAGGPQFERFGTFLATIALYDLIVALVAWATFDFVVED
jgi:heme exporter protein B